MNKVLSKLLATVIVAAMILGFLPAAMFRATAAPQSVPANTVPAPCMFLVGSVSNKGQDIYYTNTTTVGTTFVVTAWINTTASEGGWVGAFDFNATQVHATTTAVFVANSSSQSYFMFDNGIYAPSSGTPPFMDFITSPAAPDNVGGSIGEPNGFGEVALSPMQTAPTSPFVEELVQITFQFQAGAIPAPLAGPISGLITWNTSIAYIVTTLGGSESGVTFGNYQYIVQNPPPPAAAKPNIAIVNETSTTFATLTGPSGYDLANEVGTTFKEDVNIASYDIRQNMINASVTVDYSNTALINAIGVTFGPDWTSTASNIGTPGIVTLFGVNNTDIPTGTVLFATITFNITSQQTIPPAVLGTFDFSHVTVNVSSTVLYNITGIIPRNADINAPDVQVYAFLSVIPAQFIVTPPLTIEGPNPCVGNTFVVNVTLSPGKSNNIIGLQFVLQYNATLIKPISVAEGPLLPSVVAAADDGETTFVNSIFNTNLGTWGPNVLFSDLILPNVTTGIWLLPANTTDVVAEITFQVLYQPPTGTIISPLTIFNDPSASFVVGLDNMVSQNIVYPTMLAPINALYEVTTPAWQTGRMIDEYGGAVNSGHGVLYLDTLNVPGYHNEGNDWAFPAPYGGQGPNNPMDMVEPQSLVYFNAYVSYNGWPTQNKNVAFEITEPDGSLYMKTSAFTDSDGIATIAVRMPWPCDPNQAAALLGKWNEVSTVELADVVINDTLNFKYDYIIHVDNVWVNQNTVNPNKNTWNFDHGQTVTINFNFSSYFMQQFPISLPFPVLIEVSIVDNLGVTIGTATYTTTVGGAVFCTYNHYTGSVQITIPKWAYAGIATVYTSAFDGLEPVAGGVAITPEYVGPTIAILPL